MLLLVLTLRGRYIFPLFLRIYLDKWGFSLVWKSADRSIAGTDLFPSRRCRFLWWICRSSIERGRNCQITSVSSRSQRARGSWGRIPNRGPGEGLQREKRGKDAEFLYGNDSLITLRAQQRNIDLGLDKYSRQWRHRSPLKRIHASLELNPEKKPA